MIEPTRSRPGPRQRNPGLGSPARRPLRIAVLAPPWIPIPPPTYGGVENVVSVLADELIGRGHRVTLFAAPGSKAMATVRPLLAEPHPDRIGSAAYEADHVARAFASIDPPRHANGPFDVIHDHCGHTALAMADRVSTPVVHTLHGPFTGDQLGFYAEHGDKASLVALTEAQRAQAPPHLQPQITVVPNPIVIERWPVVRDKEDYLLWVGRMSPDKGPHRAIEAARMADRRLVLAGPIQPGQERFYAREVEPRLDGRNAEFIGEVGGRAKTGLFARASALLMPIRWPEPFGMVMIEALACGTPVIAFPEGSAPEIVLPGENGFLVDDEADMAQAIADLSHIDPVACRASATRFDAGVVAAGYERVYRQAIAGSPADHLEADEHAERPSARVREAVA